jgi:hypothetical protein
MIDNEILQKIGASRPGEKELTVEDLMRSKMSVADLYENQTFLLTYKDRSFLRKGDIMAVKGRAKSGKTHFIIILLAALIRGSFAMYKALEDNLTTLIIDTEQGMSPFQTMIKKALRMAGFPDDRDNDKLLTFNFRDFSAYERLEAVTMLMNIYSPNVLIIDGVRDLITDFNDISQSSKVVNLLMKLSRQKKCAIITVLHENKADNNMRGHLGTELLNKCSDVFQVSRSGNDEGSYYKVTQTDTRNLPVEDFTFQIREDGLPQEVFIAAPLTPSEKRKNTIIENFNRFMEPGTSLTYTKMISSYMEATGLAEATAKKHLPEAMNLGILIKNGDEYCRRIYMG